MLQRRAEGEERLKWDVQTPWPGRNPQPDGHGGGLSTLDQWVTNSRMNTEAK